MAFPNMKNEQDFIFENYTKIYHESDADFQDQMPDSREHAETTYGVDPDEAKAYDDAKKDIDYKNYTAWDAYHSVKEGAWSEDDFLQWTRSVWADGADHQAAGHHEDAEDVTPNKAKHDAAFGRYEQQQKKESPLERILRKRKERKEFRG
jgi:hypothetical protein